MKRRVLTNVAEAVEFAQESLESINAPVNAVPFLKVSDVSSGWTATLLTELDEAKMRIAKLKSTKTITGRLREDVFRVNEKLSCRRGRNIRRNICIGCG